MPQKVPAAKKGKVQLLRLEANKARRENLQRFSANVSRALKFGIQASRSAESSDTNTNKVSNFDPPLFLVFDWTVFPRKARQQYYDQLKTDFPGEFIYISASDDFTSLQGFCSLHIDILLRCGFLMCILCPVFKCGVPGSISRSGCSVLYDVDTKAAKQKSKSDLMKQIHDSFKAFFLQPSVRCIYFTDTLGQETDDEVFEFAHSIVDVNTCQSTTMDSGRSPTSGPPSAKSPSSQHADGVAQSPNECHQSGHLSLNFYTQRVLRQLLCRPLLQGKHTIEGVPLSITIAMEGKKCFVFADHLSTNSDTADPIQHHCLVIDIHLLDILLALEFAERVESAEATPNQKSSSADEGSMFLTGGGVESEQQESEEASGSTTQQDLENVEWFNRVPRLLCFADREGSQVSDIS